MKKLIVIACLAATPAALADAWVCSRDSFHAMVSDRSVRHGAFMVLSDSKISEGRRTIARFTENAGTLAAQVVRNGMTFRGTVDLRTIDSGRGGELLLGTRVNQVRHVHVTVVTDDSSDHGELMGSITIVKRDQTRFSRSLKCVARH